MSSVITKPTNALRVLVADDTSLYRRTISEILASIPDVEVVGAAYDGEDCLQLAEKLKPDLITLDMQMPRRDGLSTLDEIKRRKIGCEVIMVCSETMESADQTLIALRMGALDMILKPSGPDSKANRTNLEAQLLQQVQTIRFCKTRRVPTPNSFGSITNSRATADPRTTPRPVSKGVFGRPKCVCIGVSTGGPQALGIVFQGLPEKLGVPVFVVQHMPPVFTKSLADHLNKNSKMQVSEAVDGEMAVANRVYIAPGGKQMRVEKKPLGFQIQITNDPPVNACKPSVDYLFHSINTCGGKDTLAIILTGMGSDGLDGCKRLHASGARIIAQNAESCVVYGMPRQIVENNLAHEILNLNEISSRITQILTH